jgi:hypothetical protein
MFPYLVAGGTFGALAAAEIRSWSRPSTNDGADLRSAPSKSHERKTRWT